MAELAKEMLRVAGILFVAWVVGISGVVIKLQIDVSSLKSDKRLAQVTTPPPKVALLNERERTLWSEMDSPVAKVLRRVLRIREAHGN